MRKLYRIQTLSICKSPYLKLLSKKPSSKSLIIQIVGIKVAANPEIHVIPERVPLAELAIISNTNSRPLTHEENRVRAVQKNKIFNLVHLRNLWEKYPSLCNELVLKINKAKLMKFITVEPKKFHPCLVAEFYQRTVIVADG